MLGLNDLKIFFPNLNDYMVLDKISKYCIYHGEGSALIAPLIKVFCISFF